MSATPGEYELESMSEDASDQDDPGTGEVLTLSEAARVCGVARSTMRRFVQQQRFPHAHRGNGNGNGNGNGTPAGRWHIPRRDLVAAGLLTADEGLSGNGSGETVVVADEEATQEIAGVREPQWVQDREARIRELESELARLHYETGISSALAEERERTIEELRLALHTIEVDLETAPIEYEPRRTNSRRARNITFLVMIAAVGLLLYGLTRLGDDTAPTVEAPDLVSGNPPVSQVEDIPAELRLDSRVVLTASEDAEPGRVLAQDPTPGARMAEGEELTIVVSAGAGGTEVPDVVNQTIDDARNRLFFSGLNVADPPELEASDEDPGTVLRTDPEAGTKLDRGGEVTVVVSGGKES